ncbi:MAG: response regulator transcription factor [Bacteriovorax sp.]|nr:response regulator transcription factor [Bacteriovorax sp.]
MRILVIEDEKCISEILKENLQKENYVVDIADEGMKGLLLACSNNYRLILLDYNLPGLSGKQICQEMRKQKINTPILMLTARSQFDDKIEMLNFGVDDYLAKPFLFAELLARVRALLRRPKEIESEIIKISDLVIETNSFKVKRHGKEIYLTSKEFLILIYLARNMDKIVSPETLMENVWDMNVNLFSKTVKTHIMNLRIKIDKNQRNKLIHTVKGEGYMLGLKRS